MEALAVTNQFSLTGSSRIPVGRFILDFYCRRIKIPAEDGDYGSEPAVIDKDAQPPHLHPPVNVLPIVSRAVHLTFVF